MNTEKHGEKISSGSVAKVTRKPATVMAVSCTHSCGTASMRPSCCFRSAVSDWLSISCAWRPSISVLRASERPASALVCISWSVSMIDEPLDS